MFEKLLKAIKEHETVIIHRHTKPDGDAIGAQTGLKLIIGDNFPGKTVYTVGDSSPRYAFIQDAPTDEIPDSAFENALSVILDTSSPSLISDGRYTLARTSARIDHHIFTAPIADIEVTDTSFESCCGMITAFAFECGLSVSPAAARALYTGMVTDSGRFRYDCTSERTFKLASFLLGRGVPLSEIYSALYADDFENIKLRASYVLKIKFTDSNVAYIYNTADDVAASGLDAFAISRGMVGVMSDIKGVDTWVNFTETESGVLCEIRSSSYNINPVAVSFGGGGHAKASGATVKNRQEAEKMLAALDALHQNDSEK